MGSQNDEGYEEDRFEHGVDENFHCPICTNILKEPVMCGKNQHYFCTPCITRHLQNYKTCPSCMEKLTIKSLCKPPRIVTNYLSNLKIRCDYAERGCGELVQLNFLKSHVASCGFCPVQCSNEGCLMVINKYDRTEHETRACMFRKVKCEDCAKMRKQLNEMRLCLAEVTSRLETVENVKYQMHYLKEDVTEEMKELIAEVKDEIRNEIKLSIQEVEFVARDDIIIAGGLGLSSVEEFHWSNRVWLPKEEMNESRWGASSVVYKEKMIVSGGEDGEDDVPTDAMSIEMIQLKDKLPQWRSFNASLPHKHRGHKSLICEDKMLVIGGCGTSDGTVFNHIYQLDLVYPFSSKLISCLSQPRCFHAIECFDEKILIFGGKANNHYEDCLDSVVMYDVTENECKEIEPLPFPIYGMATVRWNDNVIVLGGVDQQYEPLNTVIMYNITTGESKMLPCMKCKRDGCTAVISGKLIVVMGGYNREDGELDSVECFSFNNYSWEELPPMNQRRWYATAVTKP